LLNGRGTGVTDRLGTVTDLAALVEAVEPKPDKRGTVQEASCGVGCLWPKSQSMTQNTGASVSKRRALSLTKLPIKKVRRGCFGSRSNMKSWLRKLNSSRERGPKIQTEAPPRPVQVQSCGAKLPQRGTQVIEEDLNCSELRRQRPRGLRDCSKPRMRSVSLAPSRANPMTHQAKTPSAGLHRASA
jgi:hypothetical protein